MGRVGCRSDAHPHQHAAVAHRARARIATAPAEALGALLQALSQRAARERQPLGVDVGVVAQPQLDRIDAHGVGELVHRRFQGERAARLTRRAHKGRRGGIHPAQAVRDRQIGCAVKHRRQRARPRHELVEDRRLRARLVHEAGEAAVGGRSQRDALNRARPETDRAEHLRPRQRDLHRAADQLRRHRRQDGMRPQRALTAESAADELRHDAHARRRQAEDLRELAPRAHDALRRLVHREPVAIPLRDRRVRFHRVVVFNRNHIGVVHFYGGLRERGGRIAFAEVGVAAAGSRFVLRGIVEARDRGCLRVAGAHQRRGVGRVLEGVGDDHRDRLTIVVHDVVLQHHEGAVAGAFALGIDSRRVARRHHVDDAGRAAGRGDVDGSDASARR